MDLEKIYDGCSNAACAGTFLKDSFQLLNNFTECNNLEKFRYQLCDDDLEDKTNVIKKIYNLTKNFKNFETYWDEALPKNTNIEDLHKNPKNIDNLKNLLNETLTERINNLYNLQIVISFLVLAYQTKILTDFYQELKICKNTTFDKNLFDTIDKEIAEIKKYLEEIDKDIKNSTFELVNAKIDLLGIKFDKLNKSLNNIELELSGKKSKLESIKNSSRQSMISSGLNATSSWLKFIQYTRYSGESKFYLVTGLIEAIGYTALSYFGYKINRMTPEIIVEVEMKIAEANKRKEELTELREKIALFRIEMAKGSEKMLSEKQKN